MRFGFEGKKYRIIYCEQCLMSNLYLYFDVQLSFLIVEFKFRYVNASVFPNMLY